MTIEASASSCAGEAKTLSHVEPSMTILRFLQEGGMRIRTKETCGQSGRGACRVVLADVGDDGRLRYRPVTACPLINSTIFEGIAPQVGSYALEFSLKSFRKIFAQRKKAPSNRPPTPV